MISKIKTTHLAYLFLALLILYEVAILTYGKVETKESFGSLATSVADYCTKNAVFNKGKENCYAEEFKKIGEEYGPESSFQVLSKLQMIDKSSLGCHLISHGIGWGSYKREPKNWRGLIQRMPTVCNYGAIHGVLESYILSLPEKSLSREIIPTICGKTPRADCNHIVGHLLLVQTDADVPKALDLCEVFQDDATQNNHCISGVFMEYQTALNLVSHDLVSESWLNWPARISELEMMCRAQVGKFAIGCWEEIVHAAAVTFQNDAKKVFDFCASAQSTEGGHKCKRHAIGVMGASRNFNLASLGYMCELPQKNDSTFKEECYSALVASALSTIPSLTSEAVSFCNSVASQFKPSCFSMIGNMGMSSPDVKNMLPTGCTKAPSHLQNYCLGISSTLTNPSSIRTTTD